MAEPALSERRGTTRWLVAAVLLCGIIGIVPVMQAIDVIGVHRPAPPALRAQAIMTILWLAGARPIAARWSLADSELRALGGLAALAVLTTALASWALVWLLRAQLAYSRLGSWVELLLALLPVHALTLGLISLVGSWTSARRLEARAAQREAALQTSLVRAELEALRSRLQPHFLLNALNTVAGLARAREGDRAADVAADLGELLRFSLAESGDAVPFDAEREIVERYLAIEQARLGARLTVTWRIDAAAHTVMLPALIWQPLVENAVRHGIARRSAPGELRLEALVTNDALVLVIEADGPDRVPSPGADQPDHGLGIGLTATQRRLTLLYGEAASLVLTVHPTHSRADLRLPRRDRGGPA